MPIFEIRILRKPFYVEEFREEGERKNEDDTEVHEDLSTASTIKVTTERSFPKRFNESYSIKENIKPFI